MSLILFILKFFHLFILSSTKLMTLFFSWKVEIQSYYAEFVENMKVCPTLFLIIYLPS